MYQLILASESPRRRELLQNAKISFDVFSVKVSENLEKNLTVDEQILSIARRKAVSAFEHYKPSNSQPFLILSADTMVVLDNSPLGKPDSSEEACRILGRLSGKIHQVKTAVCILEPKNCLNLKQGFNLAEGIETTEVHFKKLNEKQIEDYVASGEPMDKAGAYGIQGLGGRFVEKFFGPYDNVVGLPVDLVRKLIGNRKLQK